MARAHVTSDVADWTVADVALQTLPDGTVCASWIASPVDTSRGATQHIRLSFSEDGGQSWCASRCVMHGLCPLWSPILFYDPAPPCGAQNSSYRGLPGQAPPSGAGVAARLLLFYSESRKYISPGGDVKVIESRDRGQSWGAPHTLLTHEADGDCPKLLTGCGLLETRSGAWILPLRRVPVPSGSSGDLELVPGEPSRASQQPVASVGVLVSRDRGRTWRPCGHVSHSNGCPLVITQVEELEARPGFPLESRLLMRVTPTQSGDPRSEAHGLILQAASTNGGETWGDLKPAVVTPDHSTSAPRRELN